MPLADAHQGIIEVRVKGVPQDVRRLALLAARVQSRYLFQEANAWDPVTLYITMDRSNSLFTVGPSEVAVSSWRIDDLCRYAGLERSSYLLLCCTMGLLEQRALRLNPLLRPEDLFNSQPGRCLFSVQPLKRNYALLLENPLVCPACQDFFRCLGCEPELEALQRVLTFIGKTQTRGVRRN